MPPDVLTLGETMVLLNPARSGPMKYLTEFRKQLGGAESNVAIGLARLDHDVGWFSALGDDPHGDYVKSFVRGEGVDVSTVQTDPERPTGLMFKERAALGETSVYYYRQGSAASAMTPADLPRNSLAEANYLHFTGITPALSESCHETVERAISIAGEGDARITFDPNVRRKLWDSESRMRSVLTNLIAESDVVFPGTDEGELLFETTDPAEIAKECLALGAQVAVVTRGEEGAYVAGGSGVAEEVPPYAVERVVDPIGAGDGFVAGFLSGQLEGMNLVESTKRACAVGAFATTVSGDVEALPSRRDLAVFTGEDEAIDR
ncbi:sugar kinase [Halobacteriales archaeon QS_3_64_16]|nr:MAG: sugar kinase [Halobacteriales archaeon QS_3_64_16]